MSFSGRTPEVKSKSGHLPAQPVGDSLDREEFEFPAGNVEGWEEGSWQARLSAFVHGTLVRAVWVALVALLSLGSAGLVAATGQPPASGNRLELTYAADRDLSARLDAGLRSLARMNDDVIYLGTMARDVLANVSQVNQVKLATDYQDGDTTVANISLAAAALRKQLGCQPSPDSRRPELVLTYSTAMVDRWNQACAAIELVTPLAGDWANMVSGSKLAMQVASDMSKHDDAAASALQLATQGRYPEALTKLAQADAAIADADGIRATLAKAIDVSTLRTWLSRTTDMDDALGLLWRTMIASKGRVTAQVTAALKAVNEAKALLPDNNKVLTVVLYEMSGNLTADGISIETAKGQLANALADLTGVPNAGS